MYHLGQFIPGHSPLHRLDPRIKILSVVVLSIAILRAGMTEVAFISFFLFLTAVTARMTLRKFLNALRPLAFFLGLLFFLHLLFTAGHPMVMLPFGMCITREGLQQGLLTTWQFAALVTGAFILTMTTAPSALIGALERLLRPLDRVGISSQDLAVMISLALRFVPTLLDETDKIRKAQLSRGADFKKGGPLRRIKVLSTLAIPLALGSFRRAEDLARAMEGRGYGKGPRTYIRELRLASLDYTAAAVMISFLIFIYLV